MDITLNSGKAQRAHVRGDRKRVNTQISRKRRKCVFCPHELCVQHSYVQIAEMNARWKCNGILTPGLLKTFLYAVGTENKNKSIYYISIYSPRTNNWFFSFLARMHEEK